MKYIAYGSNMVQEQMAVRCPDARLIGTGYIAGARLEFYLHATVEKTGDQRNRVPVAVWEINDRDERSLDRYEGYPSYYIKERWPVHMSDGSQIEDQENKSSLQGSSRNAYESSERYTRQVLSQNERCLPEY